MKIIYDYHIFNWQKYGGVSRFFCEIASKLDQITGVEARILAGLYANRYLALYNSQLTIGVARPFTPSINRACNVINRQWTAWWLAHHPVSLVHTTNYGPYRWAPPHCPTVLSVHDMMHEVFVDSLPASEAKVIAYKAKSIANADLIICPSENTKRDLLKFHPTIPPEKIAVIYHGHGLMTNQANTPTYDKPYILFVGNRDWYKNFDRLLSAYGNHPRISRDFNLICFGGGPFTPAERSQLRQLGLNPSQAIQTQGDDADLLGLYQHAALFIYPSLYEGFGYPPFEAMAGGCPVACSNSSCFPETVANAAELFDPTSLESIQAALEHVLYSPSRAAELVTLGYQRIQQFSWQSTAQEHLQVYADLVN